MSQVITVATWKGGVGKSITALFYANILADQGKRVLLLDMDCQNSLTSYFINDPNEITGKTILEVLTDQCPIASAIVPIRPNLHFVPVDGKLSRISSQLTVNRDFKLHMLLDDVRGDYDYIVIDTPPVLGLATNLALVISNYITIPTRIDQWSISSIGITVNYINELILPLHRIIKNELRRMIVLPTHTMKNNPFQTDVIKQLSAAYGPMLFDGITQRIDIQKLGFIGKSFDLRRIDSYGEYVSVLAQLLK